MLIEGALSIIVAIMAYFLLPNWGEFLRNKSRQETDVFSQQHSMVEARRDRDGSIPSRLIRWWCRRSRQHFEHVGWSQARHEGLGK